MLGTTELGKVITWFPIFLQTFFREQYEYEYITTTAQINLLT